MAWSPKTFDINSINGGKRYQPIDGVKADDINKVVEGSAYAQALATQQPNIENANKVGTPSVSIEVVNDLPRLKFENLKGEAGTDHGAEIAQINGEISALKAFEQTANKSISVMEKDIADLYLLSNATVTGTDEVDEAYSVRQTANSLNGLIDGALTRVEKIQGKTVLNKNLLNVAKGYYSQGLSYVVWNNGYTVNGIGSCTDTDIVIPPTYNGKPVVMISRGAFNGMDTLNSVAIPNSVETIGAFALGNCQNLTKITFWGTEEQWDAVEKDDTWKTGTPAEEVISGISYTINTDGSVTLNGEAYVPLEISLAKLYKDDIKAKVSYYQSLGNGTENIQIASASSVFGDVAEGDGAFSAVNQLLDSEYYHIYIRIEERTKVTNKVVYPMLNYGETAEPYTPYFIGAKNAYFKSIKSTGKNILKFSPRTHNYNGVEATFNADGSIKLQGTAEKDCYIGVGDYRLQDGVNCCQHLTNSDTDNVFIFSDVYNDNILVKNVSNGNTIFTTPTLKGNEFIRVFVFLRAGTVVDEVVKPFLGYGETEIEYEPYKEDTSFMLDNAVELGEYDYIEPENNKIIKATRTVILDGVKNKFSYIVNHSTFYNCCIMLGRENGLASAKEDSFIINNGFLIGYGDGKTNVKGAIFSSRAVGYTEISDFCVWFTKDSSDKPATVNANGVPSENEANAYLKQLADNGTPLIVAYELATPIEKDIDLPTNKYQAWNGGSETLLQGDTDNSVYGAKNTIEQIYAVKKGGIEQ